MESIGHILKAARERRQISIADVVAATKMSSTFVKAIEADDFGALVAPVYARGFIKLYAVCVGLDPTPLLKQFDASSRAMPALVPLPSKAWPSKASVAYAEKLKPPRLQQSGPLPRPGATGKPDQEKTGGRSKALGLAVLATASPLRADAHSPVPSRLPAWWASLIAGRWSALNRLFSARVQWPQFKLPGSPACNAVRSTAGRLLFPLLALPVIIWRRIFIVASVVLLIIAASMAWDWSRRGLPTTTDACRWLAEPPAPYLTVDARTPPPGR